MKKVLALLLAVVMVFGALPAAALAAGEPEVIEEDTYGSDVSVNLGSSKDYVIPAGETVTVEEGRKWTISKGATLTVKGTFNVNGRLDVNGTLSHEDAGVIAFGEEAAVTFGGGHSHALQEGDTVVIGENASWTVAEGSSLYVYGHLVVRGTLTADGYVTAFDNGDVLAKCWLDDGAYKYARIINAANICSNETAENKRYFAEVHMPELPLAGGFDDAEHKLVVKYLTSRTGSEFDYLSSDLYYETLESADVTAPKWYFADVYTSGDYDPSTGMLKVPLNQYLFLKFDFTVNGKPARKYDGDRMAILFNRAPTESVQGVCTRRITAPGVVEYLPAALAGVTGANYQVWKDSYFLRQERIYIPAGKGYSAFGVNGEVSAVDQTVRLGYGEEFKFRVNIDSDYSDSSYAVYLVQGYKWNERNHEDTLESLVDEVYIDGDGNPQHFVWKFEPFKDGANQKVYIDQYGVYHIPSVEDEYTIMVSGVVSNDTLSLAGGVMDTIRNLINALKQLFEKIMQLLRFGK